MASYGYGSSGNQVKKIQDWLGRYGYATGGDVSGVYGAGTQAAVNQLQTDYGLTANGTFDQAALDVLYGIRDGTAQKVQPQQPTVPEATVPTVTPVQPAVTPTVQPAVTPPVTPVQPAETPTQTPAAPEVPTVQPGQDQSGAAAVDPDAIYEQLVQMSPQVQIPANMGISGATMGQLNSYSGGYKQSESVQQAIDNYKNTLAAKPGAYQSKYDALIQDLYKQISSREPFAYDVNGDALYQMYRDQYTQGGQQAMMDTMGQAAALTGGYGNSYASTAGNQAYQQYMTQLANKVPELAQIAYGRYQDEGQRLYDLYNMNVSADERDYGRYADTYNWWQNDLDRAQQLMLYADETDYGRWAGDRSYWTDRANTEMGYGQWATENAQNQYWNTLNNAQDQYWANKNYNTDQYWAEKGYNTDQYWANKEFDYNSQWADKEFENDQYWAEKEFEYNSQWADKEFEYNSQWADKEFNAAQESEAREYAYNTAMNMLSNGLLPSQEMLDKAGISAADAQAIVRQYAQQNAPQPSGSGGGGGGRGSSASTDTNWKTPTMSMYEKALELYNEGGADGVYAYLIAAENNGYNAEELFRYVQDNGRAPAVNGGLAGATIDVEKMKDYVNKITRK